MSVLQQAVLGFFLVDVWLLFPSSVNCKLISGIGAIVWAGQAELETNTARESL